MPEPERKNCRTCLKAESNRARNIKAEVVTAYGGKCVCCGEAELLFLTIDHKNNDGAARRKEQKRAARGGSRQFYVWIKKAGFPTDLQIMCFNCNCGRHLNGGVCPHKHASVAK